jgi:hypothetical protein
LLLTVSRSVAPVASNASINMLGIFAQPETAHGE